MHPREVAFNNLQQHFSDAKHLNMRKLFEQDKDRFKRFSLRFEDILLDYSKNLISAETMALLLELAKASDVESWRDRMFHGEKINDTEHRAVLHIALRNRSDKAINIDGEDVMPAVRAVIDHMSEFAGKRENARSHGGTDAYHDGHKQAHIPLKADLFRHTFALQVLERINSEIEAGRVRNRNGDKIEKAIDEGLLREDGQVLYIIEDSIPIMLIDQSIKLD